jgi:hypothetical protein
MRQRRHCKRFFDHKYIIKLFLLKTASLQNKIEKIINQTTKIKTKNSRKEYTGNRFLPVRGNKIALQYATLKQDTSRY